MASTSNNLDSSITNNNPSELTNTNPTSVIQTLSLDNTLAWLDVLAIYWHLLTNEQKKSYVLDMLDGKSPPQMQQMQDMDDENKKLFARHIGMTIKRYRLGAKMTQVQLAEKMGQSVPWITYIESGRRNIINYDLMRVARLLHIPFHELFIINPLV